MLNAKARNLKEIQRNSYLAQEPCITDTQLTVMTNGCFQCDRSAQGWGTGMEAARCGIQSEHNHLTCAAAGEEVQGEVRKAQRPSCCWTFLPEPRQRAAQCSLSQWSLAFQPLVGIVQDTRSSVQIRHLGIGQEKNL